MTLYFENGYGFWRPIGECKTEKDVSVTINKFLQAHNYKSYYTRTWDEGGWRHYDVGSWSEAFHWRLDPAAKIPEIEE